MQAHIILQLELVQVVTAQSVMLASTLQQLGLQNHQRALTVMLASTQQQLDPLRALIARQAHTRLILEPVYHQRAPTAQLENIRMLQELAYCQHALNVILAHTQHQLEVQRVRTVQRAHIRRPLAQVYHQHVQTAQLART